MLPLGKMIYEKRSDAWVIQEPTATVRLVKGDCFFLHIDGKAMYCQLNIEEGAGNLMGEQDVPFYQTPASNMTLFYMWF